MFLGKGLQGTQNITKTGRKILGCTGHKGIQSTGRKISGCTHGEEFKLGRKY